ncbi:hypothetical protein ACPXCS_01510 [Streptomyces sp. DT190]|jgi:hypothetical protein|uniref:hypothetical protein n=1 Tax=unclassified Streptomyces TaxID=2593676 RepID=UPI003CEC9993
MSTTPTGLPARWSWPLRLALALSGWLALAATLALPDAGAPRLLIVCVFLLLCPGAAATRWARPTPWHERGWPFVVETALLAVVLSLCLAVLAAEPYYLSGSFTTTRVIATLAAVTSVLALLPAPGRHRPPARRTGPGAAPATPSTRSDPTTDTGYGPGAAVRSPLPERPGAPGDAGRVDGRAEGGPRRARRAAPPRGRAGGRPGGPLFSGFESSTSGLYFTGLATAPGLGPLMRSIHGTGSAVRRLTAAVTAGKRR